MLDEPPLGSQCHHYTSWVYEGGLTGEHKERLAKVPEEIRQYVRERVECLFSLGKDNWRV